MTKVIDHALHSDTAAGDADVLNWK